MRLISTLLTLIALPISSTLSLNIPLFSTSGTSSRRGWIKQAIGGAVVTAAVANKIAIRGPFPYQPPENSLDGKVMIITGGNTGLGFESAKRVAKAGATVIITSRNVNKGERAVNEIKKACKEETGVVNDRIYSLPLDLCDLRSVKSFPDALKKTMGDDIKIDVLLNNAGVMAVPELELTTDGYERTFQTNHLGHFALTALLFPLLAKKDARVINLSSAAHQFAAKGLEFDNLNGEKSYGPWSSYSASKLENILFTKELQTRVNNGVTGLENFKTFSLHPGAVRTDLSRYLIGEKDFVSMMDTPEVGSFSLKTLVLLPLVYFTKSVERGATTQVWLASGQGEDVLKGGEYLQNCKVQKLISAAENGEQAKELWSVSEKLSGVKFKI